MKPESKVYIDGANMFYTQKKLGWFIDWKKTKDFLTELIAFIEKHITETILAQDLSNLLDSNQLRKARKSLKQDTLIFLRTYLKAI